MQELYAWEEEKLSKNDKVIKKNTSFSFSVSSWLCVLLYSSSSSDLKLLNQIFHKISLSSYTLTHFSNFCSYRFLIIFPFFFFSLSLSLAYKNINSLLHPFFLKRSFFIWHQHSGYYWYYISKMKFNFQKFITKININRVQETKGILL